ncbi:MAG TPA: efflux RND transporter periplasmic adaptor subunit [Gemmatimonadaceae bacterium]|nr:efflux RND transporter periplasmic adaptor subunit [Gemmatimonadaceae bacterium]
MRPTIGTALLLATQATTLAGCDRAAKPDAYGNFEATEVVVSAQTSGQLQRFTAVEGARIERGTVVALVDTTQLALQRTQSVAQRAAATSRGAEVAAQLRALEAQREIAQRAFERAQRLFAQQAATAQQLDQAERDYRTLAAQVSAARAQRESASMEAASSAARVEQLRDQLARSAVTNPQAGTVLATYARAGEVVQPGQPLYRIADLDTLVLRAYLSGSQLAAVKLGQQVQVHVDRGNGKLAAMTGAVTWISPTAEFTPTPVQTRDERADLVYAVKVTVPNADGMLKVGMPGDITLGVAPARAATQ